MSLTLLPDPGWVDAQARCVACGYSLAGLVPPTRCPECGLPYSGRQFLVHGVADARSTMSPLRIAGVVAICIVCSYAPQVLIMIGFTMPWWVTLTALVVGVALLVAFIVSSPRSHGGTARIVFDYAGVTVVPMVYKQKAKGDDQSKSELAVCLFTGNETVELRQVSDTWAKLRIRKADGGTLFSGGIQSTLVRHDEVVETLRSIIRGGEAVQPPPQGTFQPRA